MWSDNDVNLSALRAIQQEARDLAGTLASAAETEVYAEFTGGDDAGAVEVTIDATGAPTRVRLDRYWQETLGPTGLGAAVMAALSDASTRRLTVWARDVAGAGRPER